MDDIEYLLESGNTPSGDTVGSNMTPVIRNTSQLSREDRLAMAEYLKSLPAVHDKTLAARNKAGRPQLLSQIQSGTEWQSR